MMMKNIFIIPLLLLFLACNKKEVVKLDFSVQTERTNYKVGDTVKFILSGNPDQLLFYSGLEGSRFIYRNRTIAESDNITLDFATNRRLGTDAQQPQSLKLFASQKFNGQYLEASINETTDWVDITSAFTLSTSVSGDVYTNSGVVNLLTLGSLGLTIDKTKPIYFAFKFTGNTGSTQRTWRINRFDIKLTTNTDNQIIPVISISGMSWNTVKFGTSPSNFTFNSGVLQIVGGGSTALSNQVWAVSNAVNLISVKSDIGTPLKNISTRLDEYTFIYNQPGNYKVTFEAFNINVYGESRVIKELEVNIAP
ncbi:DUF5017 domain-containing protein [Pedobacter glucosidilyticus]|uniref:DUF5017 domain-containing protein n=1 Tax=Pedobacter glucosidilyticus TaxID=1122941 RepID=UPI00040B671D|nr:DUF5017 domain-containing protein [Pedobacter glucosidilyticus]